MSMLNFQSALPFTMTEMGDALNKIPNKWSRIRSLGMFVEKPRSTTTFQIDRKNGIISLLPTAERGGNNGAVIRTPKPSSDIFKIHHIPARAFITAEDVQNVRGFAKEFEMQTTAELIAEKLMVLADSFDATDEYMLSTALGGVLSNAQGDVLEDFYQRFGIAKKQINFDLNNAATDIGLKCEEVWNHIELNLLGDVMTGIHCLASRDWWQKFISHPKVKEAYDRYASLQEPNRTDVRRGFFHKGITFEQSLATDSVLNADGTTTIREHIPQGKARFFPIGTRNTFETYLGPPDTLSGTNRPGVKRYMQDWVRDPYDKFIEMPAQMNFAPMCKRPEVLVEGLLS